MRLEDFDTFDRRMLCHCDCVSNSSMYHPARRLEVHAYLAKTWLLRDAIQLED